MSESKHTPERWYCLDRDGVAMLCAHERDARAQVAENDYCWPGRAPHRAVLMGDVSDLAAEVERLRADLAIAQECAAEMAVGNERSLLAELAAERRKVGARWQPIETAPKDGTKVDLWLEPNQQRVTQLRSDGLSHSLVAHRQTDCWFNGSVGAGWTNVGAYNGRFRNHIATHWMPLPAPPVDAALAASQKE